MEVVGDTVVPAARGEKMCHDVLRSLKVDTNKTFLDSVDREVSVVHVT